MVAPLTIGAGITLGAGIGIGPPPPPEILIITSTDFINYSIVSGGGGSVTAANTNGYNYSGSGNLNDSFYQVNNPQGGVVSRIQDAFTAASLDIEQVYVFDATFYLEDFGSGPQAGVSRKVRISYFSGFNQLYVLAVDESNGGWTSGPFSGTALSGQFTFPLTIDVSTGILHNNNSTPWGWG